MTLLGAFYMVRAGLGLCSARRGVAERKRSRWQRSIVVGAGITGLSAARPAGAAIDLCEGADHTGGLAAASTALGMAMEKFYHHLFTGDKAIILVESWASPTASSPARSSVMHEGRIVPFDSPAAWFRFPGFNLLDVARFGLVSAFLRFTNPWRRLEQHIADAWMRRWYGEKVYNLTWRPLLIGKFGPYYQQANMAWMWARLKVRSPRLGYFEGGFQFFVDTLTEAVRARGGEIHLRAVGRCAGGAGRLVAHAGGNTWPIALATARPPPGCSPCRPATSRSSGS